MAAVDDSDQLIQLQENQIIFGKNGRNVYIAIRELGSGAFGSVFEVVQVPPNIKLPESAHTSSREQKSKRAKKKEANATSSEETDSNRIGDKETSGAVPVPPCSVEKKPPIKHKVSKRNPNTIFAKRFAIKCEDLKLHSLKHELEILTQLKKHDGRHFCNVVDRAKTDTFKFIVMTLAGDSLLKIKEQHPKKKLSYSSGLRVAMQCLEAIEVLHECGYLHRDIKPANFAIGLKATDEHRVVFMLDFGLTRRYKKADGRLRLKRERVSFRGTLRFAPLAAHRLEELGRRDDLESWLYLIVELVTDKLIWRTPTGEPATTKNDFYESKIAARQKVDGRPIMLRLCPSVLDKALAYIDTLGITKPDYKYLQDQMRKALQQHNVADTDPYDWEEPDETDKST